MRPPNPFTPAVVHFVAAHVRKPDIPGDEVPTVGLEPGVVIRRSAQGGQGSRSRVEIPSPLVAIAHRHLAAELDDLSTLRHLNEGHPVFPALVTGPRPCLPWLLQ